MSAVIMELLFFFSPVEMWPLNLDHYILLLIKVK